MAKYRYKIYRLPEKSAGYTGYVVNPEHTWHTFSVGTNTRQVSVIVAYEKDGTTWYKRVDCYEQPTTSWKPHEAIELVLKKVFKVAIKAEEWFNVPINEPLNKLQVLTYCLGSKKANRICNKDKK